MITRNAMPLDCALHCLPSARDLEARFGTEMVIDGEYFSGSLANTLSEQKRGWGVGQFWVFDAVPYTEWAANSFTQPLAARARRLKECFTLERHFMGMIHSIPIAKHEVITCAKAVWDQGQEGMVIKDANSLYTRGRTKDWLKVKQTHNAVGRIMDAVITDNRLKLLIVEVNGYNQRISSIPPAIRDAIWRSDNKWSGRQVEVIWNDVTQSGKLQGARILRAVSNGIPS